MFSVQRNRFLALVSLVFLICSLGAARPRRTQRLQTGNWGGTHIAIEVGPGSATIDYDCANGTINGPLTIDRSGRFSWRGSHHREHGGPIRNDEAANERQARYSGWIRGDTMTLTVKLADTNEVVGTYALKRGSEGRVFKCK